MTRYIFIGNNSFEEHKRGVENVIEQQMNALEGSLLYYIHWGTHEKLKIKRRNRVIDVGLPNNIYKAIFFVYFILKKYKLKDKYIVSHNYILSLLIPYEINVFTVHDGLFYQNRTKNRNWFFLVLFYFIEKYIYSKSLKLHFVSNYTKINSLYRGDNFEVIYNNCRFELMNTDVANNLKVTYFNSFNLVVRSIEERANLDVILKCAELNPLENFIIAGKGPLLVDFMNRCSGYKNIYFTGYIDDVSLIHLYKTCKSVIVPARAAEGFGLPVIEGYFFNKIVFASNIGALPEVLFSERYIFKDAKDLIYKLSNIVTDFSPEEFYSENYSKEIIYNKYRNFFI